VRNFCFVLGTPVGLGRVKLHTRRVPPPHVLRGEHVRRVRVTDTPPTEREMEYLKSNQYISIYRERWRTVVAGAMGTCL